MADAPVQTTDSERWLADAHALIKRCVPEAPEHLAQAAAYRIVGQISRIWCRRLFDG